jgi:hypothetical protein
MALLHVITAAQSLFLGAIAPDLYVKSMAAVELLLVSQKSCSTTITEDRVVHWSCVTSLVAVAAGLHVITVRLGL